MEGVPLFDRIEPHSSEYVAFRGYSAMEKGRRLTIPGLLNKLGAYSAPLMPDALLLPLVQRLHNK
jgi:short-subunit dehydrogenase